MKGSTATEGTFTAPAVTTDAAPAASRPRRTSHTPPITSALARTSVCKPPNPYLTGRGWAESRAAGGAEGAAANGGRQRGGGHWHAPPAGVPPRPPAPAPRQRHGRGPPEAGARDVAGGPPRRRPALGARWRRACRWP